MTHCSASLRNIIKTKSDKLKSKRIKLKLDTHFPAWLVILCDLFDDIRTTIFPENEMELDAVKSLFAECGYDFSDCAFEQIWLMSEASRQSMRIDLPNIDCDNCE